MKRSILTNMISFAVAGMLACTLAACAGETAQDVRDTTLSEDELAAIAADRQSIRDKDESDAQKQADEEAAAAQVEAQQAAAEQEAQKAAEEEAARKAAEEAAAQQAAAEQQQQQNVRTATFGQLEAELNIHYDIRDIFNHGTKTAQYQKYIVLHDTEGTGDAASVINSWENAGRYIAAHFVINKDGSVWQAVSMEAIGHHAGYGDTGNGGRFGVPEDGRDDMRGASPIGGSYADYGMNAYSIGIEMVHVGGDGGYPEAQLETLDKLIAYIDAYYGFESTIIDHKMWRTTNSDTSAEFSEYLRNYIDHRTHN